MDEPLEVTKEDFDTPSDMKTKGQYLAQIHKKDQFFGDYYVLSKKRSQFHYVALGFVHMFSLSKDFLFKKIFSHYPEFERLMVSEAFSRYVRQIRKPCTIRRREKVEQLNKRLLFSRIQAHGTRPATFISVKNRANEADEVRDRLRRRENKLISHFKLYKVLLEELNCKYKNMFARSVRLHEAVKRHVLDLEESVLDTEQNFKNEVDNLVKEQEAIKCIKSRELK